MRSESRLRAASDKILFLAFLSVGFVGIFVLKRTSINPLYVTALAVASMVMYAVFAWFSQRVRLRPDRLGDNLYYMGFVFTLASMAAALMDLQGGADVSTLIGSFGIALFSTIAGIALRVFFQQFRTEVEDVEQIVRQDLIDAAQSLRGQLNLAVTDLESFRLGVRERVQMQLQQSLDDHGKASTEHLRKLETLIGDLLHRLRDAFDSHREVLSRLNSATNDTAAALQEVIARFGAINPPQDILERKLEPTFDRITHVIAAYEATADADRQRQAMLVSAVNEFRETITQMGRQVTRLKKQSDDLSAVAASGDTLTESLSRLTEQLGRMSVAMEAHREQSEQAAGLMQRYQHGMADSLETSRKTLSELQGSVEKTAVAVAGTSSKFASELNQLMQSVEQHRQVLFASAADAEGARQRISGDLEASRTAVVELERSLARTAQGVVAALANTREGQG